MHLKLNLYGYIQIYFFEMLMLSLMNSEHSFHCVFVHQWKARNEHVQRFSAFQAFAISNIE